MDEEINITDLLQAWTTELLRLQTQLQAMEDITKHITSTILMMERMHERIKEYEPDRDRGVSPSDVWANRLP